jgi:hypothetical protein
VFYDASNADVWSTLSQADKDAVEDFLYAIGRGDYTPWTASDVGGSPVPEELGAELVRHFRSTIPVSAPGAEAAESEVSAALQESGMWPRIWQGLGLAGRRVATRRHRRAVPAQCCIQRADAAAIEWCVPEPDALTGTAARDGRRTAAELQPVERQRRARSASATR